MKVKEVVSRKYVSDEGFTFTFQPVDHSIIVKETPEVYEVRYLVQDPNPTSPDEDWDKNCFLVHYHDDFFVKNDLCNLELTKAIYRDTDTEEVREFRKKYWTFPVASLIHSGVWLTLGSSFSCDPGGWDTSHVGLVVLSKEEWKTKKKAFIYAEGFIKSWNQYLSGNVYGIVKERFTKTKEQIDCDSCWGYYGYKESLESLKTDI